jgi:hypothetical protein
MSFDPNNDLPVELWNFVSQAGSSPEEWRAATEPLSTGELLTIFEAYLDARTELVDRLSESGLLQEESEDGIEDISDACVAAGQTVYQQAYALDLPTPLSSKPKLGILESSYYDRTGQSPFDLLEED